MAAAQRLFSRPYRLPSAAFRARTSDGVMLSGSRLGERAPAIVFCHGFLGWHRKARLVRFVERLARRFTVYAFDFRGHGDSEGRSTYGDLEALDVDAVVRLAARETGGPVATMGLSMGGSAVIRQAALMGGPSAVVSVSAPARWVGHSAPAARRMLSLINTEIGRALAGRLGYRLAGAWNEPESPLDVVDRIAPVPLTVVHGVDDHLFDVAEAHRLYRAAREPKRLLLASRFGHAEDGLTPAFAELIADRIESSVGRSHVSASPHVPST